MKYAPYRNPSPVTAPDAAQAYARITQTARSGQLGDFWQQLQDAKPYRHAFPCEIDDFENAETALRKAQRRLEIAEKTLRDTIARAALHDWTPQEIHDACHAASVLSVV